MTRDALGIRKYAWQCDCFESHFVTFTAFDDTGFLDVHVTYYSRFLWDKIKNAWRALFDPEYIAAEVAVTPEIAREMIQALQSFVGPDTTVKVECTAPMQVTSIKGARLIPPLGL